jgi:hypothetical protein
MTSNSYIYTDEKKSYIKFFEIHKRRFTARVAKLKSKYCCKLEIV